jgi:hypothetical protein
MIVKKETGTEVSQSLLFYGYLEILIKKYFYLNILVHSIHVFSKHIYQYHSKCSNFCYSNYHYFNPLRVNYFHITNRASASSTTTCCSLIIKLFVQFINKIKCRY